MILFLIIFCVLVTIGFGVAAAVSDSRGLIIPNVYPAGIMLAFVPAYAAFFMFAPESGYFQGWISHLGAFALVFAISFALFTFHLFGAGDSKLATAFALWVGMEGVGAFVLYMALAGGVLGVATLLLRRTRPFPNASAGTWLARAQAGDNAVPYGIAITVGALIAFVWLGYAAPENLRLLGGSAAP